MSTVSRKWIHEHVETLIAFGGQVTLENLDEYATPVPRGGFDTTLTRKGIEAVECGQLDRKFNIYLPNGLGWAECWGKQSEF